MTGRLDILLNIGAFVFIALMVPLYLAPAKPGTAAAPPDAGADRATTTVPRRGTPPPPG